jgi:hypothetical protein
VVPLLSSFEKVAGKFATVHFSAQDVFAFKPLNAGTNYAHGWQGDKKLTGANRGNRDFRPKLGFYSWLLIRQSRPSIG